MRATIARMKQLEYALCHVQCKMFKLKVFPVKAFALNNYFENVPIALTVVFIWMLHYQVSGK